MEETQRSADQHAKDRQETAIIKEMMPYLLYALIPLAITITIAMLFAPKMTLP